MPLGVSDCCSMPHICADLYPHCQTTRTYALSSHPCAHGTGQNTMYLPCIFPSMRICFSKILSGPSAFFSARRSCSSGSIFCLTLLHFPSSFFLSSLCIKCIAMTYFGVEVAPPSPSSPECHLWCYASVEYFLCHISLIVEITYVGGWQSQYFCCFMSIQKLLTLFPILLCICKLISTM